MNPLKRVALLFSGSILLLSLSRVVAAQESLVAAKDLYASASYEEALTVLDRLKQAGGATASDLQGIEQYRAFCLLALGREAEAGRAMEAIVLADPFYHPDENEVSPRVRTAFQSVRVRVLPAAAQERYQMAKATFERKEHVAAVDQFTRLLTLLQDPDLAAAGSPVTDLRTLANGFLELAKAASAPPPPPPAPKVEAPPPPPTPAAPRTYDASDTNVTPPVAIRQDVPPWPRLPLVQPRSKRSGVLQLLINEAGQVESAVVRQSINSIYDGQLVAAAKNWRYKPALKDGKPVKFLKTIQVSLEGM